MQPVIRHTWIYEQTPEEVWAYLTQSELIAQWLMENDFQPVVGHEFRFRTRPLPQFDFDGIVYCQVLELVPLQRLVYSWKGGSGAGHFGMDTTVSWTLTALAKGTELQLEHKGFTGHENPSILSIMDEGWLKNMKRIGDLLNGVVHGKK